MKWIDMGARKRIFWFFEIVGLVALGFALAILAITQETYRLAIERFEPIQKRNQEVLAMVQDGYSTSVDVLCYIKLLDLTLSGDQCELWKQHVNEHQNEKNMPKNDTSTKDTSTQSAVSQNYDKYLKRQEEVRLKFLDVLSFDSAPDLRAKVRRAVVTLSDAYDIDGDSFVFDSLTNKATQFYAEGNLSNTDKNQMVLRAIEHAGLQKNVEEILSQTEIDDMNVTHDSRNQIYIGRTKGVTENDFTNYYYQILGESPEQGSGAIDCVNKAYDDKYHLYYTSEAKSCGGLPVFIYTGRLGEIDVDQSDFILANVYIGTVCVYSCVNDYGFGIYNHPIEVQSMKMELANLVSEYDRQQNNYLEVFNKKYTDYYKYVFKFEKNPDGTLRFIELQK